MITTRSREPRGRTRLFFETANGMKLLSRKALKRVQKEIQKFEPGSKQLREFLKQQKRKYPELELSKLIN